MPHIGELTIAMIKRQLHYRVNAAHQPYINATHQFIQSILFSKLKITRTTKPNNKNHSSPQPCIIDNMLWLLQRKTSELS